MSMMMMTLAEYSGTLYPGPLKKHGDMLLVLNIEETFYQGSR